MIRRGTFFLNRSKCPWAPCPTTRRFLSTSYANTSNEREYIQALEQEIEEYNTKQEALLSVFREMMRRGEQVTQKDGQHHHPFGEAVMDEPLYDRSCPNLEGEYLSHERKWPDGIPTSLVSKALQRTRLNTKSHPWLYMFMMKIGAQEPFPKEEMDIRWHGRLRRAVAQQRLESGQLDFGNVVDLDKDILQAAGVSSGYQGFMVRETFTWNGFTSK